MSWLNLALGLANFAGRLNGMSNARSDRGGWLFGAGTDLLLGCGLGSMLVMLVQAGLGGEGLSAWVPGALLVLLFSLPHYGATLVRVYEDPADRRKYRLFSVWATLLVATGFVASLYGHLLGSLLLTIYLTWSPWHYTGQNYGITLMLAGRRGAVIDPRTKRFVHVSFVASFLLTFLAIHSGQPEDAYAPVSYGGTVFELLPIGIPHDIGSVAIVLGLGVYLTATGAAIVRLWRAGAMRAALPSLILMTTQALWFVLPVPIRHWQLAGEGSVFQSVYTAYGFLWIAGYHAVQYLWITTYYATASARPTIPSPGHERSAGESGESSAARPGLARARLVFLGKAALAGYAVWTVPALVFAPGLLGQLPHESGLALMVAAMVNIHHFILDGVVWKLRDGRVARVLLRAPNGGADTSGPTVNASPRGAPWGRRIAQGVGGLCVLYGVVMFWTDDLGFADAISRGDVRSARSAVTRLAWAGRDGPSRRTELGRTLVQFGDSGGARAQLVRSLELRPTARAYQSLGLVFENERRWQRAASAYDSALALEPDEVSLLFRAGRAWLEGGRPERAVPLLSRALELAPEENLIALNLARARREADAHSTP
jgi:hypothetical protein